MIESVTQGYNATIFAYGQVGNFKVNYCCTNVTSLIEQLCRCDVQTGSGKTHSMEGYKYKVRAFNGACELCVTSVNSVSF